MVADSFCITCRYFGELHCLPPCHLLVLPFLVLPLSHPRPLCSPPALCPPSLYLPPLRHLSLGVAANPAPSCIMYSPVLNGVTMLMLESTPVYPTPACYWELVAAHKAT
ncbi:hypothetical protein DFH09DRAFT_1048873 [Mycena vulgaris]|nr:hypothetical protein DFH09DRAFT_1048873 [Mycena vulgaris]